MKKIVLPLALLASITTLTSCTQKTETPTPIEPVPTTVETPVVPTVTTETTSSEIAPEVTPATPPVSRTETVTYATPAGNDPVEFSVTLTDGVITKASATPKSTHEVSKKLQTAFSAELESKVVGKKVSDLDTISAIGGASLATGAFKRFVQAM